MHERHAPPPARSRIPAAWLWRALAVGAVAIFVLRLTYFLFQDLADGHAGHVAERVFNEATGALLAAIPLGATCWLSRRVPLAPPVARRQVITYGAGFVVLSLAHTAAMVSVRAALAPAFGLHDYGYDFRFARFAYEAANDFAFFAVAVALLALAESVLAQRERERHAAALERSLLRAELSNLRLQLQPHFLFNALNTISSTMYDDVERADAQLGQLAELLRTSLRTTHAHEVPARDELRLLSQYLELMQARFGDRLGVTVDAPDDVGDLLVPSMVLQPLVENAVRHGGVSRLGRGRVTVTLRRAGDELSIRVHDDGPPTTTPLGEGTGLSSTARRLRLLYGDAPSMHAGAVSDGFAVELRIPARQRAVPGGGFTDALDSPDHSARHEQRSRESEESVQPHSHFVES